MSDDAVKPIVPDYESFPTIVTNLWARLAQTIEAGISDVYVSDGPEAAIRHALCAEACYWQARGDDESPSAMKIGGMAKRESTP